MKKTKIVLLIFLIIIIASTICISIGLYLNRISKPNYIFSKGIDIIRNKLNNYNSVSSDLDLKDKFSIKGNIEFDLESEYYKKSNNPEDMKIYNLINNLDNMDTSFKIQKNQSKKIGYIEINEKIGKEDILDFKYCIDNSTKYYFVKDIVDNYINDGSCNFFENINANTTEKETIEYIYNFIIDSLKNNLKDEYFTSKEEKDKYVVSLKINNDNLIDILNGIIKDLKNDKKARRILDNIDKKILKTKIKNNKEYLEKGEYYKISIYTSKILYKPIKYEVERFTNNDIEKFIYEGNDKKGTLYYLVNEKEKYTIPVEFKKDLIKAKIKNPEEKTIGEFKLDKNNYNTVINYTLNDNNEKIDLIYSSKYSKVNKNNSYTNKKNLSFKYIVNKETKLSGEVNVSLDVSNKFSIITDITEAKLKSNVTEEEKEKLDNLYKDIKNRLER